MDKISKEIPWIAGLIPDNILKESSRNDDILLVDLGNVEHGDNFFFTVSVYDNGDDDYFTLKSGQVIRRYSIFCSDNLNLDDVKRWCIVN